MVLSGDGTLRGRTRYFRFNIICRFSGKHRYQRQENPASVKRFLRLLTHVKCLAFIVVILAGGTAAGGEEIELIIGEFNVLVIGELHDLIHIFTVFELFLLFIAQVGEDPFQ